jgi:hypothetical protein
MGVCSSTSVITVVCTVFGFSTVTGAAAGVFFSKNTLAWLKKFVAKSATDPSLAAPE